MDKFYGDILAATGGPEEFADWAGKMYKRAKILFIGPEKEREELSCLSDKHVVYSVSEADEAGKYADGGINIVIAAADFSNAFAAVKNWGCRLVFAPSFENLFAVYPYGTKMDYILLFPSRTEKIKGGKAADLFGGIAARAVTLFDYYFASRVYNKAFSQERFSALESILEEAFKTDPKNLAAEDKKKLASFACALASKSPARGGDYCIFKANLMIQTTRKESVVPYGQLRFISALKAVKAYLHTMYNLNADSYPPPVYVVRSRVYKIYTSSCPFIDVKKESYAVVRYRYREYKEDLKILLNKIAALSAKAERTFRRFFEDAGLQIGIYEKTLNNAAALYISPDTAENYTMLSFMRDGGILEILTYDTKRKRKI